MVEIVKQLVLMLFIFHLNQSIIPILELFALKMWNKVFIFLNMVKRANYQNKTYLDKSRTVISGINFLIPASWSLMKADFIISDIPNILFFKAILRKPLCVKVSISSLTSKSPHLQQMKMYGYASWCCFIKYFQLLLCIAAYPYPSRLKARTAFGPIQTLPSIRGVKCTPRKGNRGSGTYYKSLNIYSTMYNAGKYFRQKLFTRK